MIKRPMLAFAAAWLSGLLLCHIGQMELFGCILCYTVVLCGCLLQKRASKFLSSCVTPKRYPQLTLALLLLPVLFGLGWLRGSTYEEKLEDGRRAYLALFWQGEKECFVTGIVQSFCLDGGDWKLTLADCAVSGYQKSVWQEAGGCEVRVPAADGKEFRAGNEVWVYGKLSVAREATNPGQFDAFEYYATQGIYATVYAIKTEIRDSKVHRFTQAMCRLREWAKGIFSQLYGENEAGILSAMLMGDKTLLPEDIKRLYQQNGISHVLAISGLHISLLAMGLFRLLSRFGVLPKVRIPATMAFLLFYVLFTGGSVSAWRAATMCFALLLSYAGRKSYDTVSALAAAAIFLTAMSPWELKSAGFLLSFGAVLGVVFAKEAEGVIARRMRQEGKKLPAIKGALLYSGMIACVTTPISLLFFYEFSLYGFLLNLLVLPFVSVILMGGLCSLAIGMVSVAAASVAAGGTHLLLWWYELVCTAAQKLPFSQILIGEPKLWQLAGYYAAFAGAFLLFLKREAQLMSKDAQKAQGGKSRHPMHLWASVLLFAFAWGTLLFFRPHSFRLSFLDVSQGDCIVVTTKEGETFLFDCGSTDVGKVGQYRLAPFLKQQGIGVIDVAAISHMDADHMNGIKELLEMMQPYHGKLAAAWGYDGTVSIAALVLPKVSEPSESYLELVALAKEKQVAVCYMEAGEKLAESSASTEITCLSPKDAVKSENDTSLVFLLETDEAEVWLMGDAGIAVEQSLLAAIKEMRGRGGKADAYGAYGKEDAGNDREVKGAAAESKKLCILKVGHHGSRTSSDATFLKALAPDVAVISCGYQNRYGHPHTEVSELFWRLGITVYRTDLGGAVSFD